LLLLPDARRAARMDASGEIVLLADQDRSLWNHAQIAEGRALILSALRRDAPGPYSLEAAIAAVHDDAARSADTDWPQIVLLYDRLYALHSSPVVALNHAAAVSMASGPAAALPLIDALSEPLAQYYLWHSARADLLRRLGRRDESAAAYRRALDLSRNDSERRFLLRRLAEVTQAS
jgi:RNA polymerase sigma-70 factor (ECF subfamily)